MYTHQYDVVKQGSPIAQARAALIMVHGRGGSPEDILGLADQLSVDGFALYAPRAANGSWYPYSFMAEEEQNQPALDSALDVLAQLVGEITAAGIPHEKIYFLGFSQGACLTLEFVCRNAMSYGGIVAFTGGVIGRELNLNKYNGDFLGTPALVTTGVPDSHVPLYRVEESIAVLKSFDAHVRSKMLHGRPHTITDEEIELANNHVFKYVHK